MGNGLLHTREVIILVTIEVMDEYGVHEFSTREIAKRVGISEPAIFKHFKSKSGLLLAVLDHFSLYDTDIIQSIRSKNLEPFEAINFFIDTYTNYYQNYPAITAITQNCDLLRKDPILSEKIKSILLIRTNFISEQIVKAQRIKKISEDIDSESLAIIITGMMREWCLDWRISNYSYSLRDKILNTLKLLLGAFAK